MKARVQVGWIEPEALAELEAQQAADQLGEEMDLTEEEKALLALGELGSSDDSEELEIDLEALAAEGGDEAAPQE